MKLANKRHFNVLEFKLIDVVHTLAVAAAMAAVRVAVVVVLVYVVAVAASDIVGVDVHVTVVSERLLLLLFFCCCRSCLLLFQLLSFLFMFAVVSERFPIKHRFSNQPPLLQPGIHTNAQTHKRSGV